MGGHECVGRSARQQREGDRLTNEDISLRARVARLSWLTIALLGVTMVLLFVALWVGFRADAREIVGQLPLGADDNVPSVSLIWLPSRLG